MSGRTTNVHLVSTAAAVSRSRRGRYGRIVTAIHPYLDWPGPIPFAHRGGTSEAPENTMPAFEHAVSLGFRYLETDVHLSADGVLMAFHDPDLTRTCGVDGTIAEMTAEELAGVRVDGRAPIPLMSELLERFPDVRFNIDCKSDAAAGPLTALIRRYEAVDRVCLGAFSHARLSKLRTLLGPELLSCMSPQEVATLRLTGRTTGAAARVAQVPVRYGAPTGPKGVTVVTERFVRNAHRRSVPVHVWTIDDADEMHQLLDLGVDGIMTDRPEVLRDVLIERGQWHETATGS
jgi:glycerophosphoryl diester phosphodiesterase